MERISVFGYKQCQKHIFEHMASKFIEKEKREEYMKQSVLVKEDKKHRCYHFFQMFEELQHMRAEDFAVAIKGKPENLNCTTAYDLLFNV